MGEIFSQLGRLFVQSIPTVIFVFLLLVILDRLFFGPLIKVLKEREEKTQGALARAREQAAAAQTKSREYEEVWQATRQAVYRLREAERRQALAEREETLKKARGQSEALLKEMQASLAAEVNSAKQELEKASRALALDITQAILGEGKPQETRR